VQVFYIVKNWQQLVRRVETGRASKYAGYVQSSLPAVENSDLRQFVAHRESVQAADTLEAVHKRFAAHEYEFMLVMDGDRFAGLCERQKIGMVLGARYGFAMHSRQPVREAMLPEVTVINTSQPLSEVLRITCSRPNTSLYDDVVLTDEKGNVLGLVFSRTLVRLQNQLLQVQVLQLENQQKELNKKNEQMQGDLHLAREIQLAMLPTALPEVAPESDGTNQSLALRFQHRYESAGVVSGDFFHVLKISDSAVGIFICDVMGHGVRSAFVTAMLRALVEEMQPCGNNPGELLTRVNAELMRILKPMESPLYATAFYLVADAAGREIRFARAGHPNPLLLRRATGELISLNCSGDARGPALGMVLDARYGTCGCPLEPRDLILLFTDGIYEVFDAAEKEFGLEKLGDALKQRCEQPLGALLDGLVADARSHSADRNFDDDVCLIALEAVGR
jgi:sigma-B regulation protein RsbU (phosphoserine phosphatase)